MSGSAVLVPGYRGSVRQPILTLIAERLDAREIASRAVKVEGGRRPSPEYREEIARLRAARDELLAEHPGPIALVGRSFGGRICAFLASEEPPSALVVVGHPISPPGRRRERDEEALATIRCPTLVVQGQHDELGPVAVLERIAAGNPLIDLIVIAGAGHDLGRSDPEAAEHVARWLAAAMS